jgi:hypothetical protein
VIEMLMGVEAACAGCGTIFEPTWLAEGRYFADTGEMAKVLRGQQALRTRLVDVIGKNGSYKDLRLPSWFQQVDDAELLFENARDRHLQNQPRPQRETRLRHALGLTPDHPELHVPAIGGDVIISNNLVRHLGSKSDSGHNQLAHLTVHSIRSPREVWERDGKQRFIALYRIGDSFATHIVVVNSVDRYVHTSYEIDNSRSPEHAASRTRDSIEDRTNAKRGGECQHVGYLPKP